MANTRDIETAVLVTRALTVSFAASNLHLICHLQHPRIHSIAPIEVPMLESTGDDEYAVTVADVSLKVSA